LLSEEKSDEYYTLSNRAELVETESQTSEDIFAFTFFIDKVQKDYIRKYKKLQDLAAEIGGVMKIIMIFLRFLANPLVAKSFKKDFVQSVFGGRISSKHSFDKNIELGLNISRAFKLIREKIDIKILYNKMNEIEKLTKIVLEPHQYCLFKHYCSNQKNLKDYVNLEIKSKTRKHNYSIDGESESDKAKMTYYRALVQLKLKEPDKQSIIDKNFLNLLKEELEVIRTERKISSENTNFDQELEEFSKKDLPNKTIRLFKRKSQDS
jgi:hypothetical protein